MVSRYTYYSCGGRVVNLVYLQQRVDREVADHELVDRLFVFWDYSYRGALSFQVRDSSAVPHMNVTLDVGPCHWP